MGRAAQLSLFFLIVVSWAFGGGVSWGPYLVGGGGLLCLVLVLAERGRYVSLRKLCSWRLLPWVIWLVLVGISIGNPSHAPKDPELSREYTKPHGGDARDTLGTINPAVPIDHIEWLPTTSDVGRTGLYLFTMVGIMAFGMAVVLMVGSRQAIRRWLIVLFVNTLVMALAGYWFFFHDPNLIFGKFKTEGSVPFASFHYKNCWTAYAILSAVIGLGLGHYFLKQGRSLLGAKSPTAFFLFATPLILLSLPLCGARAGLVLTVLLMGWLLVVAWIQSLKSRKSRKEGYRRLVPAMVLTISVIAIGWYSWTATASQFETMFNRSERQIEQVNADQPTGRMLLIRDTIEMAKVKPWFGWGLATFSQVYPIFQGPELYRKLTFPGGEDFVWVPSYYEFTHCDWVQYWAEMGLIGFLLLLATPVLWFVHYWRKGRSNPVTHWLGFGCVLVLLLATFEFPFGCEAVSLLFAACLALGGKYALLTEESRSRRRKKHG